jgi:hypothetical protein
MRFSVAGLQARCDPRTRCSLILFLTDCAYLGRSVLRKKAGDPISNSPFLLPYTLLSPAHDDAHKDTEPYHIPSEGKWKRDQRGKDQRGWYKEDKWETEEPGCPYGSMTTTGATDIRGSSERIADSAGLHEGCETVHRSKKARRTDETYQHGLKALHTCIAIEPLVASLKRGDLKLFCWRERHV